MKQLGITQQHTRAEFDAAYANKDQHKDTPMKQVKASPELWTAVFDLVQTIIVSLPGGITPDEGREIGAKALAVGLALMKFGRENAGNN